MRDYATSVYIALMGVDPAFQRRGIASALMGALLACARTAAFTMSGSTLALPVRHFTNAAVSLTLPKQSCTNACLTTRFGAPQQRRFETRAGRSEAALRP